MIAAPSSRKFIISFLIAIAAALVIPQATQAAAGAPQNCAPSSTCVVGEFLYDDSYTPITDATCTLTSRDPDGDLYQDGVAMIPAADGWYSVSFTAPATTGYYRGQVCCTSGTDYLCLDKSFEIVNSTSSLTTDSIATAVWGYSGRTLSSFGTLAADVWASSTRTLSSFGNLISDIWGHSSRTVTATVSGDLANQADVDALSANIAENRALLEKLVNKPIIENTLEEVPDLGKKMDETKSVTNKLFINSQYVASNIRTLANKWKKYSDEEISNSLDELLNLIGEEGDNLTDASLLGQIDWMKTEWNFEVLDEIYGKTKNIRETLALLSRNSDLYKGKIPTSELKNMLAAASVLEKSVGEVSDLAGRNTMYGRTNEVFKLASDLNKKGEEVDKVLAVWTSFSLTQKQKRIAELKWGITKVNILPKINSILVYKFSPLPTDKELKNNILGLKGIVESNKLLLASKAGQALSNTWVEEGSMIFKTLVTNPSTLISQTVPLKYYLPPEVKEENVIEADSGLTVSYDTEKDQYYVEGSFTLKPSQTKTLSVRVDDVWVITDEEIASLRKQAEDLAKPLERTSYFAQGVTLKSDINVSLDKVIVLQKNTATPEEKIRAYREAKIELSAAQEKIAKLKELATQAGSAGTLFGFVGGAQTLAVWGLILVIIAGFIWMTVSMKTIMNNGKKTKKGSKTTKASPSLKGGGIRLGKTTTIAIPFAILLIAVGVTSSLVTKKLVLQSGNSVLGEETQQTELDSEQDEDKIEEEDGGMGGADIIRVRASTKSAVLVYKEADKESAVIDSFKATKDVVRIRQNENWVFIVYSQEDDLELSGEGWVEEKYIIEPPSEPLSSEINSETLVINDTPTGWLRVRTSPRGEEIGKVNPGETYPIISEKDGWYEIEISGENIGWVSGQYASIIE
jgi:hypothetical protein